MVNLDSTIQDAVKRAGGNDDMTKNVESKEFYETAKKLGHANALNLARNADSEEERNFFAFIANMNLQREQKKAIERNAF